jgi:hypothetical protein
MKKTLSALLSTGSLLLAGCTVKPEYSATYTEICTVDSLFYVPSQELRASVWNQTQGFVGVSESTISEKKGIIFHCGNKNHPKHILIDSDAFERFFTGDNITHHYQQVYQVTYGLSDKDKDGSPDELKREFAGNKTKKVHQYNSTCEDCNIENK